MKLSDYALSRSSFSSDDLLSSWHWLVGNDAEVIVVTRAGDCFLKKSDGIYFLCLAENRFEKACDTIDNLNGLLSDRDFVSSHFAPQSVDDFLAAGHSLDPTSVIGFKIPPFLGGSFDIENLESTDASVHFSILGQLAFKIKDLPDGTPIGDVTIS